VHRSQAHLDAYVEGWVIEFLQDDQIGARLQRPENAGVLAELSTLEVRRAEADATLARLVEHPTISPDALITSIEGFDRRIAELRGQLGGDARGRLLAQYQGLTREQWTALPLQTRRALVKACYRVVVHATGRRGPGFDASSVEMIPVATD
jgi:hypothetical protein